MCRLGGNLGSEMVVVLAASALGGFHTEGHRTRKLPHARSSGACRLFSGVWLPSSTLQLADGGTVRLLQDQLFVNHEGALAFG